MELEDDIIPSLEEDSRPSFTNPNFLALKTTPENKLKKLFYKRKSVPENDKQKFETNEKEEIQV